MHRAVRAETAQSMQIDVHRRPSLAMPFTLLTARANDSPSRTSCSQILITLTPSLASVRFICLALLMFPRIFVPQYSRFCLGIRRHRRQPCQKQPSTKTARRSEPNQKSGAPGTSRECKVQPRIPDLIRAILTRTSVERFPLERTLAINRLRSSVDSESMVFRLPVSCGSLL
jgi:hypothetical protein